MAAVAEEARARNVPLLVSTLSNGIQVHPDPKVRAEYARRLGVADLDYPDRRVKSVADEVGFPVLNLVYPLRAQAEATGTFLHGFKNTKLGTGHWNEHGHALAGKLIAAELCRILGEQETLTAMERR